MKTLQACAWSTSCPAVRERGGAEAAAAIALSELLRTQLYDDSPADPATFLGIGALLVAVAVAASWVPAWRASRVEPVRALRGE